MAAEAKEENVESTIRFYDREKTVSARRREYETVVILSPAIDEARAKTLIDKAIKTLEDAGGLLLRKDDWGKMKMAYEIEKHAQGRYVYFRMICGAVALNAFERLMKLEVDFLRFQSVRLSEDLSESEIEERKTKVPEEKILPPNKEDDEEADFQFR